MRRLAFLLALLILAAVIPAGAEVFLDREPPAEWAGRDDVMRLTSFQTVLNDCTLLEVGGKSMLIDGGVRKWRFQLKDALAERGYDNRVDILFNTHPHDDHLQCVYYLVRQGFTADEFWTSFPASYRNELHQKMLAQLEKSGIPCHQLSQFETVDFGGATLVFYWWEGGKDPNARSALMHVTFGASTVLMAADIGGEAEAYLLREVPPELLKADILKYPHHGIRPARADFIDAVDPSFAFVNSFGPSIPETMKQMEKRGIPCFRTTMGRVEMTTDGTDWYIVQYRDEF